MLMRFHTQTAGVSLTAQQPQVNIVRTAIEALAAVLGGTQSLHTNSYDEALALPTEEAVRIALRTQQVIAHETGVTNTADPLGGSYFVEKLTDEMEAAAYAYFARIDELGGMVDAIKTGFPQREIADAAFEYQREVETKQRIVVGVNGYRLDDDEVGEIHRPDPAAEARQRARLERTKAARDEAAVEAALADVKRGGRERREPDAGDSSPRREPAPRRARSSPRSRRCSAPTPSTRSSEPFSAGAGGYLSGMPLKVIRNEVDGWDVIEEHGEHALSNHPTRESAEEAARMRAESCGSARRATRPVVVDTDHVHAIDDARQGMKPAFLALAGLLAFVTVLVIVLALTGSLTGFGS